MFFFAKAGSAYTRFSADLQFHENANAIKQNKIKI